MTDERKQPTSEEAEVELELDRETVEDLDAAKEGEEVKGGWGTYTSSCPTADACS